MNYPIYTQCENSLRQAQEILDSLRQRRAITETTIRDIHRRRHTADIAMQATFEELRHAFITPIDREDIWRLRQITEAVVHSTEDAVLTFFRHRQSVMHPNDNALLCAVNTACRLLQAAMESFPSYPRSNAVLGHLTALEKQHRQCEELTGSEIGDAPLKNISAACFSAAEILRYILLKVT